MIVWKVTDGYNCSLAVYRKASVQYKIGKIARAPKWLARKGFHLFAFKTLRAARRWVSSSGRIYRAEAKKTTQKLPQFQHVCWLTIGEMIPANCSFPLGTIMCKEITLLDEVKDVPKV